VTLSAYVFLFTALISFVLVQYSNVSNSPHIFKNRIGQVSDFVARETFQKHAETAYKIADALSLLGRDALLFTDVAFSLKFILVAVIASVLCHYVSPIALAAVPFILSFVVFLLYEKKQKEIDDLGTKIATLWEQKVQPILNKVPLEKVQLKEKID